LTRIGAVVLLAGLSSEAWAQAEPEFSPTPDRTTAVRSPLLGTAAEPLVRVAHDLLAAGILPRLRSVQSIAANPVGGLTQGTDASGVVIFGADADLNRIAGWQGAQLHITFAQFYGHELSTDHIGSRTKVQSFYYPRKQFELSEFTFQQKLFNDRLDVVVGRANATGEFARSTYGCRFQNVADCPYELTQAVAGFPGFPYVNWGGRVRYNPTPQTFAKVGAFQINAVRNTNTGFNWGLDHSTGFVVPGEIGYGTEYANDPYPRHFKLGGWYNSADYTDPYYNTAHKPRGLVGGKPASYAGGRGGYYALADQVVYRAEQSTTRGVAVFASGGAPLDSQELFAFEGVAGAVWTGPSASRPNDEIGLLGSYIRVSNLETGYLNSLLKKARSISFIHRNQFIFETNYSYRIVEGVYLAPGVQYIINPDTIGRPSARKAPPDALVFGLKFSVNANEVLGLPSVLSASR